MINWDHGIKTFGFLKWLPDTLFVAVGEAIKIATTLKQRGQALPMGSTLIIFVGLFPPAQGGRERDHVYF